MGRETRAPGAGRFDRRRRACRRTHEPGRARPAPTTGDDAGTFPKSSRSDVSRTPHPRGAQPLGAVAHLGRPHLGLGLAVLAVAGLLLAGCVTVRPVAVERAAADAAASLPTRPVLVDGVTLALIDTGSPPAGGATAPSPSPTPVVLLHGFGASSWSWRRVIPELATERRVLAPDLAGFGWSDRPADRDAYGLDARADRLVALLDHLGVDRAHLVGHSYGGGLALTVARDHPDRVASLALVATTLPWLSRAPGSDLPLYRPLLYWFLRTVGLRRWFVGRLLRFAVHDPALVDDALVDGYHRRLPLIGPASSWTALTAPLPRHPLDVDLRTLDLPTLLIWGAEDRLIPVEAGHRATEQLPRARLVVYPETGHLPMEERPRELAEELTGFLREVDQGEPDAR